MTYESKLNNLTVVHDREGDKYVAIVYDYGKKLAYGFSLASDAEAEKRALKKAREFLATDEVAHDRTNERTDGVIC